MNGRAVRLPSHRFRTMAGMDADFPHAALAPYRAQKGDESRFAEIARIHDAKECVVGHDPRPNLPGSVLQQRQLQRIATGQVRYELMTQFEEEVRLAHNSHRGDAVAQCEVFDDTKDHRIHVNMLMRIKMGRFDSMLAREGDLSVELHAYLFIECWVLRPSANESGRVASKAPFRIDQPRYPARGSYRRAVTERE